MVIDNTLLGALIAQAKTSPKLRMNLNFHQPLGEKCHRMLNAIEAGTDIPIYRHPTKDKSFVVLRGRAHPKTYYNDGSEIDSVALCQEVNLIEVFYRMLTIIFCVAIIGIISSCSIPEIESDNPLPDIDSPVFTLDSNCNKLNKNIYAVHTLLEGIQRNDYITSVNPIKHGKMIYGYSITFLIGDPIVLYTRTYGKNDQRSMIGVKRDSDNCWYWTLYDEWLLNIDGNKVKALGNKLPSGAEESVTTPTLIIEDGYWCISTDNGQSWMRLFTASIEESKSGYSIFIDVDYKTSDNSVSFTFADGSKLMVQRKALSTNSPIRLLLIGSSHGMNTIAQFPWIAYKSGLDIEIGNVYIGSLSLQRLVGMIRRNEAFNLKVFSDGYWTSKPDMMFKDIIAYNDWDFIVLQRSATDDQLWTTSQEAADTIANVMTNINYGLEGASPIYMSHTEALRFLIDLITKSANHQPEILFNSGFADPNEVDNQSQTTAILETANIMSSEFGIDYVPVATAIRNARNTYLRHLGTYSRHNLCYDSQHLDYGIGCYVASITLLDFVLRRFGKGIETLYNYGTLEELLTFYPLTTSTNYTEPTIETITVAKACAEAACNLGDSVSKTVADRYKWQVLYDLEKGTFSTNDKGYSADKDSYSTILYGAYSSVSVTMNGIDITPVVYKNKVIMIENVIGDVVISAR